MSGKFFLVLGSGSIAQRHMNNILALYPQSRVGCVSASGRSLQLQDLPAQVIRYASLEEALVDRPDMAIVASPAPLHVAQAVRLVEAGAAVLVEKPLSDSVATFAEEGETIRRQQRVAVAYNLRFMPSAIETRRVLASGLLGQIHRVLIDVGQYLPDWRPASDYRTNVSARKELGGGVLLELSHELDYVQWLFGAVESVYCVADQSGALELDVEDRVDAILVNQSGLVINLHMDFLQRAATRKCKIIGDNGTLEWDVLKNRVTLQRKDGACDILLDDSGYDRNQMYVDELRHFVELASGECEAFVSVEDALSTLALVDAMKASAASGQPVTLQEFS